MSEPSYARSATAWLLGLVEVLLAMAIAVWLLSRPPVFRLYYPVLQGSAEAQDAVAVVEWLSSTHRERSLKLGVHGGQLKPKELKHYSDVRSLFRLVPALAAALALLTLVVAAMLRQSPRLLVAAQYRGLILWSLLLLGIGVLALWDWKLFWAWVHQPFFGEASWRLSDQAYSLRLFPTAFWRTITAAVLLAPAVLLGLTWFYLRFKFPRLSAGARIPLLKPTVHEKKLASLPAEHSEHTD